MTSPLNLAIYARSAAFRSGKAGSAEGRGESGSPFDGIFYHVRGGLGISDLPERRPSRSGREPGDPSDTGATFPPPGRAPVHGEEWPSNAVSLEEARSSLSLFGKGMCSRYLQARPLEEAPAALANPWRPLPFSDGREVYLPSLLDLFEDRRDNWRVLRLYVSAQVGQWEAGTFDRPREEGGSPSEPARLPSSSAEPLGFIRRFLGLFPRPGLAGEIFLFLESARVLSYLARSYRGLSADLSWFLSRLQATLEPLDHRCALWNLYFDLLGPPERSAVRGYPAELLECSRKVTREGAALRDTLACTADAYRILAAVYRRTEVDAPGVLNAEEGFPGTGSSLRRPGRRKPSREGSGEETGSLVLPESLEEVLGADFVSIRFPAGLGEFLQPGMLGKRMEAEKAESVRREGVKAGKPSGSRETPGEEERRLRYPEWDYLARGYRRDWTTLVQLRAEERWPEAAERLTRGWEDLVREVSRQFRMLRYRESSWRKRLVSGEEVDIQAVVERWVSLRCGLPPTEKVYMEKRRLTREVSALFLLDLSASTSAEIAEGDHAGETVLDLLLASVAIMARALEQLGDRFGIFGFSGYGKDRVEFLRIKSFDEAMDGAAWRRLAGLKPMKSTRMGTAVRHARRLLEAEASSLKLLLLLSDGYPQDFDYGDDRTDREYGLRDTAQALREAEAGHIVPFCVTVDAAGHDYLRRMCPPHGYLVVSSVEDLPHELPKVYLRLRGG